MAISSVEVWDLIQEGYAHASRLHNLWLTGHRYASGEHHPDMVQKWREAQGIPTLRADMINPFIDLVVGRNLSDRFSPRVRPAEDGDVLAEAGDLFIQQCRNKAKADFHEIDAFRDLWCGGFSVVRHRTSSRRGILRTEEMETVPGTEVMVDPRARVQNYVDRAWDIIGRWVNKHELRRWHPEIKPQYVGEMDRSIAVGWPSDPQNIYSQNRAEIFVLDLEWKSAEKAFIIDAPVELLVLAFKSWEQSKNDHSALASSMMEYALQAGGSLGSPQPGTPSMLITQKEMKTLDDLSMSLFGHRWPYFNETMRDVYYYAFVVGSEVVSQGEIPEKRFTRSFMTDSMVKHLGHHFPRSFVDEQRHRQDFYNKTINSQIEIISRAPKGASVVSPGFSTHGIDMLQSQFARAGAVIEGNPEKIKQLNGPDFDPYYRMMDIAEKLFSDLSADPYTSGKANDLRRVASSAVGQLGATAWGKHAHRFKAMETYRREQAELYLSKMVYVYNKSDVAKIVGNSKFTLFPPDQRMWEGVLDYDVVVEFDQYTSGERDEVLMNFMMQFLPSTLGTPLQPGPETIKSMMAGIRTFPAELRNAWAQDIERNMSAPPPGAAPPEGAPPGSEGEQ